MEEVHNIRVLLHRPLCGETAQLALQIACGQVEVAVSALLLENLELLLAQSSGEELLVVLQSQRFSPQLQSLLAEKVPLLHAPDGFEEVVLRGRFLPESLQRRALRRNPLFLEDILLRLPSLELQLELALQFQASQSCTLDCSLLLLALSVD